MMKQGLLFTLLSSFEFSKCQTDRFHPEELYKEFYYGKLSECAKSINAFTTKDCDKESLPNLDKIHVDYLCRYNVKKRGKFGLPVPLLSDCYCCGYIYGYVEYGEVCTGYCNEAGAGKPKNLDPIIGLPFNWGDDCPESLYDSDHNKVDINILEACQNRSLAFKTVKPSVSHTTTSIPEQTTATTAKSQKTTTTVNHTTTSIPEQTKETTKSQKTTTTASLISSSFNQSQDVQTVEILAVSPITKPNGPLINSPKIPNRTTQASRINSLTQKSAPSFSHPINQNLNSKPSSEKSFTVSDKNNIERNNYPLILTTSKPVITKATTTFSTEKTPIWSK